MKKNHVLLTILMLFLSQGLFAQEQNNVELNRQFIEAYHAQASGDIQQAIQKYEVMIKDNPKQPELYLNLSAIYAKQGNLEKAREILLEGLATDALYKKLFDNLQAVHGQMAANVYKEALNETANQKQLELPLVPSLRKIK